MSDADNKPNTTNQERLRRARDDLAKCLDKIASYERERSSAGLHAKARIEELQAKSSELNDDLLEKHRLRLLSKTLATRESISITRSAINSLRRDILAAQQDRDREDKRICWLLDEQIRLRARLQGDIKFLESADPFTPTPTTH